MKKYKKEIAFIISAVVFCTLCAFIIAAGLRLRDKNEIYHPYETMSGLETEFTPETIVYDDVISEPVTEDLPEGISYKKITSKTVINTENASRIVYNYPRFTGFSNEKDGELNSFIKLYIEQKSKETGEGLYKLSSFGAKVIYELEDFLVGYVDDGLISIMFLGYYDIDYEGEHIDTGIRHFSYSLNIAMENMEPIESKELFSDYLAFRERLIDGKLVLKDALEGLLDNTSYSAMLSSYSDRYQIYPDIFLEKDSVSVIVSLTADLGGYAVFTDTKDEAKVYLNSYLLALSEYLS